MSFDTHIADLYVPGRVALSFEVFPPRKNAEVNAASMCAVISKLVSLAPDFVSVTYGAGGNESTRGKTAETAEYIASHDVPALAHLACAGQDKSDIPPILDDLIERGVRNVLALRGDVPRGEETVLGYRYACELIAGIRASAPDLCIGAACYPEGHIDCPTEEMSLAHLVLKQDAGADFLIAQLCFDNALFYRFLDNARASGIHLPISAGIMPILSREQIQRMIFMCGVSLPAQIVKLLYRYEHDPESLRKAGIDFAAAQAQDMAQHGVDGIHIYTMNQPQIAETCAQAVRA